MSASRPMLWSINGRFLSQPQTGVQRYAGEITRGIDACLAADETLARRMRWEIVLPADVTEEPAYERIGVRRSRRGTGYLWEQTVLPAMARGGLVNLANLGPLLHPRQILCLHDANVFTAPGSYRPAFRLFYRTLHPLLARRAAVVTTVSEAAARDLAQHLGVPRRRIVVLPNGHEHALRWQSDPGALRRLSGTRPFVLLLGSRARHKNIDLLLRLVPALAERGLDLVLTGGCSAIFSASDREPDTAANLHRLGAVSDDELAGLMDRALCLAFPSWTEGFGLPIIEAMARGCPVIASDRASMPEVCGDAALMAAPDDPAAWLAAIDTLRQSPALRADLVGRGAEQVRRFSWAHSAAGYVELLERLQ